MRKFHELAVDDPIWTANRPLTVGSISRTISDAKTALAETRKLDDRLDDVDELLADIEKSTAVHTALIKSIEAGTKASVEQIAKLAAALDTPGTLAKLEDWERSFHDRLHKQYGASSTFDDFMASIEADTEATRKRDAFDDGADETSPARFKAQYRVVR